MPFEQFIGAGTIKGNFDHQAGFINPADTGVVDNDTDLTNVLVPTAGTITFDGNLSFNGGTIVYDMGATPGADDLVSVTGSTNLGTGGIVKPNFLAGVPAAGQDLYLSEFRWRHQRLDHGLVGPMARSWCSTHRDTSR